MKYDLPELPEGSAKMILALVCAGFLLLYKSFPQADSELLVEPSVRPEVPVVAATLEQLKKLDGEFAIAGHNLASLNELTFVERSGEWNRYSTEYGDLIAVRDDYSQSFFLLQGTALTHDGQLVLSAGAPAPDSWVAKDFGGVEVQVLDGKILGFVLREEPKDKPEWEAPRNSRLWAPHSSAPKGLAKFLGACYHGGQYGEGLNMLARGVQDWTAIRLVDGTPLVTALDGDPQRKEIFEKVLELGADPDLEPAETL